MFNLIQIDGIDLICYDNGDIWRWNLIYKKWVKFVSKCKGYWRICITTNKKEKLYLVSRLICVAFKEFTLDSPLVVDHIDHNIHNNSVENLRCVTYQQNNFNTNAKGYRKISYIKKDGNISIYWRVHFCVNGNLITKRVSTEENARRVYLELKKIYHII